MELITPRCNFTTIEKHINYLKLIKKCVQSSIDEKYVLSKKLFKKKNNEYDLSVNKKKELFQRLQIIDYSINYYQNKTNE